MEHKTVSSLIVIVSHNQTSITNSAKKNIPCRQISTNSVIRNSINIYVNNQSIKHNENMNIIPFLGLQYSCIEKSDKMRKKFE